MTEFEEASAKYQSAKVVYWKAKEALSNAHHALRIAERERSAAFNKEIESSRSRIDAKARRAAVSTSGEPK
jgi:hypothetical protein